MNKKINNIKNSKHLYSYEINAIIDVINKISKIILVTWSVVGYIIAIVASVGLAEWVDNYKYDVVDVPVNFFGYTIEIESDTFGGSPFMVFVYIVIITTLISLVLICIKGLIDVVLKSKINMLDSAYHTEQLTEELLRVAQKSATDSDDTATITDAVVQQPKQTRDIFHQFRCENCGRMVKEYPCVDCNFAPANNQPNQNADADIHQ